MKLIYHHQQYLWFGDVCFTLPGYAPETEYHEGGTSSWNLIDIVKSNLDVKSCPFCNKIPYLVQRVDTNNAALFSVNCLHCNARYVRTAWSGRVAGMNPFQIGRGFFSWTEKLEEALELWNIREGE